MIDMAFQRSSMAAAPGSWPSQPAIVSLAEVDDSAIASVGVKAATLASARHAGFDVPDGFVITAGARVGDEPIPTGTLADDIIAAAAALWDGPLAVRSSSTREDRADASFAGLYETVLDVSGEAALLEAVGRVWASAGSSRVLEYEGERTGSAGPTPIAVLVQPMLIADAAGVAFTADPMTGDRGTTIVSAIRGIGERLVSGEATADVWAVRDGSAVMRSGSEGALDADQATLVAETARRLEAWAGAPQDVEWALVGGSVTVLQSRPMTALPEQVSWEPSEPGAWVRDFRLGEWLDGPVTPLFESWAVTGIERRMHAIYATWIGIVPPEPPHIVLNGWYFYGFNFMPTKGRQMVSALVRHIIPSFVLRPRRAAMAFPPLAHFGIELAYREWREAIQPAYLARVASAEAEVATADASRLLVLVDELVEAAGTYFASLTTVGGYAAKAALPLARFYREHLRSRIGGSYLELLSGLSDEPISGAPHLVHNLDWIAPPPAPVGPTIIGDAGRRRWEEARGRRLDAEARAREALAADPKLAKKFERLLAEAQRFDLIREEQVREFTLPWPLMRGAVLQLGDRLVELGAVRDPDDVFFLSRGEVVEALEIGAPDRTTAVEERRAARERQRRLSPPLQLGTIPPMFERMLADYAAAMRDPIDDPHAMVGIPASAGRAVGPVRIVRDVADFDRVETGDILVASMTTPAWTPLFGRVAGVVTDNGGVGAHASIVAREYGVPAVVGLGDATLRLRDGDVVEVDGGAGSVRLTS
jgi:phosphohistidine swiveling domain-containing protein